MQTIRLTAVIAAFEGDSGNRGRMEQMDARRFQAITLMCVEAFGVHRLIFGSNWPVCLLSGTYAGVHDIVDECMSLSAKSDREAVFGLNALHFYNREVSCNGSAA